MRFNILTLAVALATLLAIPAMAADYVKVINVTDAPYSAVPNDANDDTTAIQNAINAAVLSTGPGRVYFPKGVYRISSTLTFPHRQATPPNYYSNMEALELVGCGSISNGVPGNPSTLKWYGSAGGTMLDSTAGFGIHLMDMQFDGNSSCSILIKINSTAGFPSDIWNVERVMLRNATTGIELGSLNQGCAGDMTFIDFCANNLTTAFKALDVQNVDYYFIRPNFTSCSIGFDMQAGGALNCTMMTGAFVGTMLKVGASCECFFSFDGVKLETQMYQSARTCLVDASAAYNCVINMDSVNVTSLGMEETAPYTPLFKVGHGAALAVTSSILTAHLLAEITTTSASDPPSFMQFDNCRFPSTDNDPRKIINCDANSGYELRNCRINGKGMIPNTRKDPLTVALPAPTMTASATVTSATAIDLSWSAISGCNGYRVERSANGTSGWTKLGTHPVYTTPSGVTTFQDTGLTANTTYYYRVRAYYMGSESDNSSVVNAKTHPRVQITSPLFGAYFLNPASVTINMQTDLGSVTSGIVTSDGFSQTDTSAPYSVTWNNPAAGKHTLLANAYNGGANYSDTTDITVWKSQDIGAWGGGDPVGSASLSGSTFTVNGAGGPGYGILKYASRDTCHFAYSSMSGNFTIVARVNEMPSNTFDAMGGVMIRYNLNQDSPTAFVGGGSYNRRAFNTRADTGANLGAYVNTYTTYVGEPIWVKLVRNGTTVSGFTSVDGITWTQLGTNRTISIGTGSVYVGLASTSDAWGNLGVSKLDNVVITPF